MNPTLHRSQDVMRGPLLRILTLSLVIAWAAPAAGQPVEREERSTLARQIEQRFDLLPLREGVALRPKTSIRGVQSIEVSNGAIAVDGVPVTGAELRERIGGEAADVVLQFSYLDASAQRALIGGSSAAPASPAQAEPTDTPPEQTPTITRRSRRSGSDRVRIGGGITVAAGEVIRGDAVAVGGSAQIDGEVEGEVVAIGGNVRLGPKAVVAGDVVVIGGRVERAEGAQVGGEFVEVGWGAIPREWYGVPWLGNWWQRGLGSTFALASTITRLCVLGLFAALVVLLGAGYVDRVGVRAAAEPLKAGAIGFLSQLLFLPLLVITIVVLVITIVGIPLLIVIPFLILGLGIVALIGFTAVAYRVGQWMRNRFAWSDGGPFVTTLAGIVALLSPVLFARLLALVGMPFPITASLVMLGLFIEYVAWTVGFGAVALVRFEKGRTGSALPALSSPAGES